MSTQASRKGTGNARRSARRLRPASPLRSASGLEDRAIAAECRAHAAELVLYRLDLVLERLGRLVDALVELEHRVDARQTSFKRDVVELPDDLEDVLDRPIACRLKRTLSCACKRRCISAMYSLALADCRPNPITVRSAVAIVFDPNAA
jgi:hypothetical protein